MEPQAITRRAIKACFNYPFEQLGCRRIYGCISEHNAQSLEITKRLGWQQEGRLRQAGFNGEDMIIMALLKEENPWK
jgi:RimJ/RimL family protein N-acetyltransferase